MQELERAARQVELLRTGRELTELTDAWKAFLDAFVQTGNKLLGGSQVVTANEAAAKSWSGVFEARLRSSVLLSYLYHARNANNHGVAAILSTEEGKLHLCSNGAIHISNIIATKGELAIKFAGTPPTIAIAPNRVVAVHVTDNGVVFHPPEEEIGLLQLAQGGLMFWRSG